MGARESGNGVLILADCFPAAGRNHAMDMRMMLKGDVQDAPLDVSGALRPLVFSPMATRRHACPTSLRTAGAGSKRGKPCCCEAMAAATGRVDADETGSEEVIGAYHLLRLSQSKPGTPAS